MFALFMSVVNSAVHLYVLSADILDGRTGSSIEWIFRKMKKKKNEVSLVTSCPTYLHELAQPIFHLSHCAAFKKMY
jgi:hypothetical protein